MVEPTELRPEQLLLRPFRFEDVDDVVAYASDDEWGRYFDKPRPYTRRDGEQYVARCVLTDWSIHPQFAVVLDDRVIGAVGLSIDSTNETAELGYAISREHWGKGLGMEATRAVVGWGFRSYDLAKVFARTDARNQRSWRLMERLGMKREGLLRSHRLVRGERRDEVVCGVLRNEWRTER